MVAFATVLGFLIYGLAGLIVYVAWTRTAGRPVVRIIVVGIAVVAALILGVIAKEVPRELVKRYPLGFTQS